MPTEKMICVKRGDITYCWNVLTCRWERYTTERIIQTRVEACDVGDFPKDVVNEIMIELSKLVKI